MTASMSREADCWDRAVSESFFATLRAELIDDERLPTRAAAEAIIGSYLEDFYNLLRLHSHLDYVSPIEFESTMHATKMAASSDCPPKRGRISRSRAGRAKATAA